MIRYRAYFYVAALLFVAALAVIDRHDSSNSARTAVASATTETAAPADIDDRPLVLPDR